MNSGLFLYFLCRVGQIFSNILPVKISYWIAEKVSTVKFFFSKKGRKIVFSNMKTITGKSDKECFKMALQMYKNFGKYLVDFFRFSRLNKQRLEQTVSIENLEIFDRELKKEKGVIGITAHIGNWELIGITMSILGYPVEAVALTHKNKLIDDFFVKQRNRHNLTVIPVFEAAKRCLSGLRKRNIVALLGDRDFSGTYVKIKFLGKDMLFPRGPAVLSLRAGAPVVLAFTLRQKNNKYKITCEKLDPPPSAGSVKENVRVITQKIASVIEKYVLLDPTQWLMFSNHWKEA